MAVIQKIVSYAYILDKYSPAFIRKYKSALLSGILVGISFVPFPVFTVFFCWIPLWFFLTKQTNLKSVVIGSWISSFTITLIGSNWVAYTAHTFGGFSWAISIFALALFCSFANLFIMFASVTWFLITKQIKDSIVLKLLLLPILFSLFHLLTPTIFPWNMGYSWLWAGWYGLHTAEIWGFKFLNTLFYTFNLLFLILYKHRLDKAGKLALSAAIILFVFLNGLGFYLKKRLAPADRSANVLLIQTNIGNMHNLKLKSSFKNIAEQSLYRAKSITIGSLLKLKNRKDIDFILWPEGAYPYTLISNTNKIKNLSPLIRKIKTPLITGAMTQSRFGYSNSLITLDSRGKIMQPIYRKNKLLAFGETLPGSQTFPFIKKIVPYFGYNLIPGEKPQVKKLNDIFLGFQICYESLFDEFTRQLALQGAQILVNITNDSWYGAWQQPWQHLTINLSRSIEVRRPIVRATNTGVSTVMESNGKLLARSPINKAWSHVYNIPYHSQPVKTLFMSWGFYINEIFLFGLLLLGFLWRKKSNLFNK